MSELQPKKSRRVPVISKDKLDETPSNCAVGYEREDQWANAFIKQVKQTHRLTVRLPLDLYDDLRKVAFETKGNITSIIVDATRKHVKTLKKS